MASSIILSFMPAKEKVNLQASFNLGIPLVRLHCSFAPWSVNHRWLHFRAQHVTAQPNSWSRETNEISQYLMNHVRSQPPKTSDLLTSGLALSGFPSLFCSVLKWCIVLQYPSKTGALHIRVVTVWKFNITVTVAKIMTVISIIMPSCFHVTFLGYKSTQNLQNIKPF